jgi:DNA polymerase
MLPEKIQKISIDIETYSEEDLPKVGVYKYCSHPSFEVLMLAFKLNDSEDTHIIDIANSDIMPAVILNAIANPEVKKHAYNAMFERVCLSQYFGMYLHPSQWYCSAVHASYMGFPSKLGDVAEVLKQQNLKDSAGTLLINYFCKPCKPTKVNGGRIRNLPHHSPEKWEDFKAYCIKDVNAEAELGNTLKAFPMPDRERELYILDQEINDRGIMVDTKLIKCAIDFNERYTDTIKERIIEITGVKNPNSYAQVKAWLESKHIYMSSMDKASTQNVLDTHKNLASEVKEVLELRQLIGKTSIKKYEAMQRANVHGVIRGMLRFYGAKRTHRWSSQIVQLHNLATTGGLDLEHYRQILRSKTLGMDTNIPDILSKLVRTSFIPRKGKIFYVVDFNAIEARVLAWLADEDWRLHLFSTGGKLYEVTASNITGVPLDKITKDSKERKIGKVAELALGYQGGIGALDRMGARALGLTEEDMDDIKIKWRMANPNIEAFWRLCQDAFEKAIKGYDTSVGYVSFKALPNGVRINLPSGLSLFYANPKITLDDKDRTQISYKGCNSQAGNKWMDINLYGGKIVENITQAVARDCLGEALLRLKTYHIVLHVHDEIVLEVDKDNQDIDSILRQFEKPIEWAEGLPLKAEGYFSSFYKK